MGSLLKGAKMHVQEIGLWARITTTLEIGIAGSKI